MQWFLGALRYSPALFAKPWMAMVNLPAGPAKQQSMITGRIASFIGCLLAVWR